MAGDTDTSGLHALARQHLQENRLQESLAVWQQLCLADPADANAWHMQGAVCAMLGRLAEAEACCRRSLAISPDSVPVLDNLARVLISQDRDSEAATIIIGLLGTDPGNAGLLELLHSLCRRLYTRGDYAGVIDAVSIYRNAGDRPHEFPLMLADAYLRLDRPEQALQSLHLDSEHNDSAAVHRLLARAHLKLGHTPEAAVHLDRAGELEPGNVETRLLQARLLDQRGQTDRAVGLLEEIPETGRRDENIYNELGRLNLRRNEAAAAADHFRRALALNPESASARMGLGEAFIASGDTEKAAECYRAVLARSPGLPRAECQLGYISCMEGDFITAVRHYDRALDLSPGNRRALAGKATALERMGEKSRAAQLLEPLIARAADQIDILLAWARVCPDEQQSQPIERLEHALATSHPARNEHIQACFELGRLYEKQGKFSTAFRHYRSGNDLHGGKFDCREHMALTDAITECCTSDRQAACARSGITSTRPVFIIGMPRSGTTLVEQILASHPRICGAGELSYISDFALGKKDPDKPATLFPWSLAHMDTTELQRSAAGYLDLLETVSNGEAVVTDKLPANFMFVGLIEMLLPSARIIHCLRDPLDTCLSNYFQLFSAAGQDYSYRLDDIACYYRQYRKLMAHWKQHSALPILDVHYEDMVAEQETTSRGILDFLGIEWNDACLSFHNTGRQVLTASYDQVRVPLYRRSIGRWKHYREELAGLREALSEFY